MRAVVYYQSSRRAYIYCGRITSLASPMLCRVLENSFCRISRCLFNSAKRAFFARISSFLDCTDDILINVSHQSNKISMDVINCSNEVRGGRREQVDVKVAANRHFSRPWLRKLPQKIILGGRVKLAKQSFPTTPIEVANATRGHLPSFATTRHPSNNT